MTSQEADPSDQSTEPGKPSLATLLALLKPFFARYRYRLLLGFFALLVVDFLQLTIPLYLKKAVDILKDGTASTSALLQIGGFLLLTALCILALRFAWRVLIIGFSRRLEAMLRARLFSHVLDMDRAFFDKHPPGDIMAHASNDLNAVQMATGMGMVAAADALVISVAALALMVSINPFLTLMAILPLPLLGISAWFLSGKLHVRFDQVQHSFGLITEFARNSMVAIRLIKGYTREQQQKKAFAELGEQYVAANIKVAVVQGLLFPISVLVGNLGMMLILYYGGKLVIAEAITLGGFVAFVHYLYMLIWPMMAVGWVTNIAQRGFTSLARIHRLLAAQSQLEGSLQVSEQTEIAGKDFAERFALEPLITLQKLEFSYAGAKSPTLTGMNLELEPGILGIAGRTGSGKSTLCRLLTRQYPVSDDMILFADQDVNCLAPTLVRGQISYVSQNPVLFSATLAENISLAVPHAPQKEIEAVAELAGLHTEILAMEKGYQTRIGERGLRLSGGQKQRLAIARALLADRPVLIIDDALSALDVETEQQVFAGIRARAAGKIVLIVSHRLKLLSGTDLVVLLDQGRIVAIEEHENMLRQNAFYQAMARKQQWRAS
ncbi:MAG: ABC transporter ATP-binding protein [Candidatus Electrothrix aestuarii]|uniref:ABC transporter ATP-binding protein n=1 Tax=Candidatus Electrothrix aestuarii TaxID=3062594 RepID=A0AAU8LWJ9_9BACT|nr:ABC transporter ATP-binding protein [Candidatus Electrothrix aestuarii]